MRWFLQICFTVMALLASASVSSAASCADDPNECTLKKLCEASTTLDGSNTIWATTSETAKHVALAQSLGMECGVTPIVDLCETDPDECKVSEICEKATTESAGQKTWDDSASGHVALAKEYGLSCDVVVEAAVEEVAEIEEAPETTVVKKICSLKTLEGCSVQALCRIATEDDGNSKTWTGWSAFEGYVKEAKKRGLSCGVDEIADISVAKACSESNVEVCSEEALCEEATFKDSKTSVWSFSRSPYVKEAKKRGLTCGVGTKATNFKKAFTSQSRLKRQQLQYALKKLGYYSYGIDGLWGKGTSSAFVKFVSGNGLKGKRESQVFSSLLSKVDVPSSFAPPKKKTVNKPAPIDTGGLTSIISNPSMTGTQALAICRPQAELAKSQARSQADSMGRSGRRTYDLDCSFGSCRARDVTPSGGAWGGIAKGLSIAKAGKRAYSAVLEACLAGYGWR